MEDEVANFASELLADDLMPWSAIHSLTKMRRSTDNSPRYTRILQEIAAFEKGSVIRKLMKQLPQDLFEFVDGLVRKDPTHQLSEASFSAVVMLSSSKAFAQACLSEEGAPQNLVSLFATCIKDVQSLKVHTQKLGPELGPLHYESFISWGLRGLDNFMLVSKDFRDRVRTANVLPAMQHLLSVDFARTLPTNDVKVILKLVGHVVDALTMFTDSIAWVNGDPEFLKLLSLKFISLKRIHGKKLNKKVAELEDCNLSLMRLMQSKEAFKKLRECNAVAILEPASQVIDLAVPNGIWWHALKLAMENQDTLPEEYRRDLKTMGKRAKADANGAEVVCSWEQCTVDPVSKTTRLSACGACGVPRYCSKEHQKMHWASHKRHCARRTVARNGSGS